MNEGIACRVGGYGRVDRQRFVNFTFDGKAYPGHPGDTLASALLANNVRVVGRSLKYHRPRGIVTCGVDEPNAIVQLCGGDDEPNIRATDIQLHDGLVAKSVNCWPNAVNDIGAVSGLFAPLLAAGFYYKTFMWPPRGWNIYGAIIRRAAGLGTAPKTVRRDHYEKRFHHCDVLVAGAGPAGLAAALCAARSGARVVLADNGVEPGGALLCRRASIGGEPAMQWVANTIGELDAMDNVRRLASATVFGYYDHNLLAIVERAPSPAGIRERLWRVRAREVVIAAGASERPLVFADNDRPGVMLASAAQAYLHRYGVRAVDRAVVVTNNNSAYESAFDLHRAGVTIVAIVDTRRRLNPAVKSRCDELSIPLFGGHGIIGIDGRQVVTGARIAPLGTIDGERLLACDGVLMSGGWNPLVHLHSQSGARPVYDETDACFIPGASVQRERSAGSARGIFDVQSCLADGAVAGAAAAHACGYAPSPMSFEPNDSPTPLEVMPLWTMPVPSRGAKAFVDYQNDVTVNDIALAVRENLTSVEHVKRYTTAGMGTDQGKLGNVNVIGILSQLTQQSVEDVGTTTFRPPFTPVSFAALAGPDTGEHLVPARRTALYDWHLSHGAVMFEAGAHYRRPSFYRQGNEGDDDAIQREVAATRRSLGIYDGSPLGKFLLSGPDVVEFLNLLYINRWDDLPIGRGRYGWMLREDGRLLDDGVTFRLAAHHYFMSCGTGAADPVYLHMENLLQLQRPDLRVHLIPVTAHWANICLCGPNARACLQDAGVDIGLDAERFKFMAIKEATIAQLPVRIARVSYTGELSFEISVRRRDARAIWERLVAAGAAFGITPVGSEANAVMRVEKGFVAAGFEGDGVVNPIDAGLGWMFDTAKRDFVGKRMVERDLASAMPRLEVIGLVFEDRRLVPPEGTPIVESRGDTDYPIVHGHVTQAVFSPTLDQSIALALLNKGRERIGDTVALATAAGDHRATVVAPCFLDPKGERMRA